MGKLPCPCGSRPPARSQWQALAVCPLLHRPGRSHAANHRLVRLSLEHRGHLSAKPGLISGWKPSGNGALPPSLGPLLVCWGCSAWWSSWLMLSTQIICQHGKLPGIPKPNPPLPMPWPLFVAICGGSGIRQPCLLPGGLSIRPMSSMTRSSKLPVMLPKMAKVESILTAKAHVLC